MYYLSDKVTVGGGVGNIDYSEDEHKGRTVSERLGNDTQSSKYIHVLQPPLLFTPAPEKYIVPAS